MSECGNYIFFLGEKGDKKNKTADIAGNSFTVNCFTVSVSVVFGTGT
jgi:hypothetical protein